MGLFDFLFGSDESSTKHRGPRELRECVRVKNVRWTFDSERLS